MHESSANEPTLDRRLGTFDAVVIGLGSMIGAGIFAAFAPAAAAAGSWLLVGLAVAAVVAYCNATSSARLAARYPAVGRHLRLRPPAARRVLGLPGRLGLRGRQDRLLRGDGADVRRLRLARPRQAVAVAAVVALTAVNYAGVQKAAWLTRVIVAVVLAVLAAVVVAALPVPRRDRLGWTSARTRPCAGVLQAAGLLFFAFAGYARIATLGEEVRDPARTIPRAIPIALGITLVVYAAVAVAVLTVLGPGAAGRPPRPAGRRRHRGRRRLAGPGRARRRGGRRARRAAGSDPGRVPHHLRDGPRPAPARTCWPPCIPASGAAPRRTRRRRRRRGSRRHVDLRGAIGFSSFGGAGVLRHRQRLRLDVDASGGTAAALGTCPRPARLCWCWPSRCRLAP